MTLRLQLLGYFAMFEGKRFSKDTLRALILTEFTSDQSTVVVKRSSGRKRYHPPKFKHPPRIAAARVLKRQPSLK